LTEIQSPFTFRIPESYTRCILVQVLTEREEQTMRHEDKSQDGMITRRPWFRGLLVRASL